MITLILIFAAGLVTGLLAAWMAYSGKENKVSCYDAEEIHENCTVQILTNTRTGDVSIGWWRGKKNDVPIILSHKEED